MNGWQRWKAKHWDEQTIPEGSRPSRIYGDLPPLRRFGQWFAKHWKEQPIALLGVVAGLIAALAALIGAVAALIQALHP